MRKNLTILPWGHVLHVLPMLVGCHRSLDPAQPDTAHSLQPTKLATQAGPSGDSNSDGGGRFPLLMLQDADRSVQLSLLTGVLHDDGLRLDPYNRIVG